MIKFDGFQEFWGSQWAIFNVPWVEGYKDEAIAIPVIRIPEAPYPYITKSNFQRSHYIIETQFYNLNEIVKESNVFFGNIDNGRIIEIRNFTLCQLWIHISRSKKGKKYRLDKFVYSGKPYSGKKVHIFDYMEANEVIFIHFQKQMNKGKYWLNGK